MTKNTVTHEETMAETFIIVGRVWIEVVPKKNKSCVLVCHDLHSDASFCVIPCPFLAAQQSADATHIASPTSFTQLGLQLFQ